MTDEAPTPWIDVVIRADGIVVHTERLDVRDLAPYGRLDLETLVDRHHELVSRHTRANRTVTLELVDPDGSGTGLTITHTDGTWSFVLKAPDAG